MKAGFEDKSVGKAGLHQTQTWKIRYALAQPEPDCLCRGCARFPNYPLVSGFIGQGRDLAGGPRRAGAALPDLLASHLRVHSQAGPFPRARGGSDSGLF